MLQEKKIIIRTANNRENYVEILMSKKISRSENENIFKSEAIHD